MTKPIRLGVLLSGGGRTLQNLLDHIDRGQLPAEVVVVIASSAGTKGEERARARSIATYVVKPSDFPTVEAFSAATSARLDTAQVDLVCLAGFMFLWQIPPQYTGRVMNIHPALIPSFCGHKMYGHHVHEAVLQYGAKVSGCTVHFADDQYDHGPIVLQGVVPVLDDDTPEALASRVHTLENELYPEAVRLWAAGRLDVVGRRVRIRPGSVLSPES